jgi:phage portal protein BeeE
MDSFPDHSKGQVNMTHITFDRSGGVIGSDMHLELDTQNLSEEDASVLRRLIDEADFFNLPENLVVQPNTDEFQYQITIDDDERSHTVRVSDSSMEKPLHPLIKELTLLKMLQ